MKQMRTRRGDGSPRRPGGWAAVARDHPYLATCLGVLILGATSSAWTFVSSAGRALQAGAAWLAVAWALQAVLLAVFAVLLMRDRRDRLAPAFMAVSAGVFSVVLAGGIWVEPLRLGALSARMMLVVVAAGALVRSWQLLIPVWIASVASWCLVFLALPGLSRALLDWPLSWLLALILSGFLLLMTTGEGRHAEEVTGRLRLEAHVDALTGVLNRAGLRAQCQRLVQAAAHGDGWVTCSFVDVDGLKWVNDTQGHAAGDEVLRRVAGSLTTSTRAGDVVGRWGGDEFLVLRSGRADEGDGFGRRLAGALMSGGSDPPWWGQVDRWVTVGSATRRIRTDADPVAELDALIAEADEEMYRRRASRRS